MHMFFLLLALFMQCQTAPLPSQTIMPGQAYIPQQDDSYRIVWSAPFGNGMVVQGRNVWVVRNGQDDYVYPVLTAGNCYYGLPRNPRNQQQN
jgi:hypothetical protein